MRTMETSVRPSRDPRRPAIAALLAAAAAVVFGGLAAGPAAAQQPPLAVSLDPTSGALPAQLRDVGFDQKMGARVPLDLLFQDSTGAAVRLGDYFDGRPVILSLVYYDCPMLCPMTLQGLAASLKALDLDAGRDFQVVTVSFNPQEGPAESAKARDTYLRPLRAARRRGRPGTS